MSMTPYVTNDLMVSFLYELMRDEVPPGVVERALQNTLKPGVITHKLSNGYLGQYAADVVQQLKRGLRP